MSVEVFSSLTNAQRDAGVPYNPGTRFFNSETGEFQSTKDGGLTPTWLDDANLSDITLQKIYDNSPNVVVGAIPFSFQSTTTDVPTFDFFSNIESTASQGIFQFNSKAKTETGIQKDSVALRLETSNATDALYSQNMSMSAWSINQNIQFLNFLGIERSLNTCANLRIKGDSLAKQPALFFQLGSSAQDEDVLLNVRSECETGGNDKSHSFMYHFIKDSQNATFSTETRLLGWFNGLQFTWLEAKGDTQTIEMYVNFTNNTNDPIYGTSIDIENYKFADGRIIGRSIPSTLTGSCGIRTGVANENIQAGSIVTVSPDVDYRMINHPLTGDKKAIGVAVSTALDPADQFEYCHSGIVTVRMEDNMAVTRGDLIGPSINLASSPGRAAVVTPANSQVMGIAWESVAGDPVGALVRISTGLSSSN